MKVQDWLNTHFHNKEKRQAQPNLYLNENHGEGEVVLSDFTNISELNLERTKVTKINLSDCKALTDLIISGDSLSTLDLTHNLLLNRIIIKGNTNAIDLSIFSPLTKLKHLDIRNSNFIGSLKSLENCKELEYLNISNNKGITDGLEYLPIAQGFYAFGFEGTVFEEMLKPFNNNLEVWMANKKTI